MPVCSWMIGMRVALDVGAVCAYEMGRFRNRNRHCPTVSWERAVPLRRDAMPCVGVCGWEGSGLSACAAKTDTAAIDLGCNVCGGDGGFVCDKWCD